MANPAPHPTLAAMLATHPAPPVRLPLGGGTFPNAQGPPLFPQEGNYNAAAAHNAPFAKPGPYQTRLTPLQNALFQSWAQKYHVPITPDYNMAAYFLATHGAPHPPGAHFPDTFKTPYDTTFSNQSQYAKPGTPFVWVGNKLIDRRTGQVIHK